MIPVLLLFALMQLPQSGQLPYDARPSISKPCDGCLSLAVVKPAPIDVPAIKTATKSQEHYPICIDHSSGGNAGTVRFSDGGSMTYFMSPPTSLEALRECRGKEDWNGPSKVTHTCADKTRILLHDEQTPPKFWCHRVQP